MPSHQVSEMLGFVPIRSTRAYALFADPPERDSSMPTIALVLFVFAALGGVVMSLKYKSNRVLIPAWLVIGHATAAVLGFVVLLVAAFR